MKIAFLGDIALIGQFSDIGKIDANGRVNYLAEQLSRYDLVVANLESPFTKLTKSFVPKSMHLRADISCAQLLRMLHVNAVSLANNHIYDFGRKGVNETIHTLEAADILWYGIDGKTLLLNIKNEKISLSGFCCLTTNGIGYRKSNGKGINTLTRENLERQIESDKTKGAVSVVSAHYGIEHTNYPSFEHIRLFDNVCKDNTVIIHGHHPHQIQGIKREGNSLIAYSLGNAIFDSMTSINNTFTVGLNEENRKSFILGVEIFDGMIVNYDITGFYISDQGIIPYEIDHELSELSSSIINIIDQSLYENMRKTQYQKVIAEKFGKHDATWLSSRLNYYSIGARVSAVFRRIQYKKLEKNF